MLAQVPLAPGIISQLVESALHLPINCVLASDLNSGAQVLPPSEDNGSLNTLKTLYSMADFNNGNTLSRWLIAKVLGAQAKVCFSIVPLGSVTKDAPETVHHNMSVDGSPKQCCKMLRILGGQTGIATTTLFSEFTLASEVPVRLTILDSSFVLGDAKLTALLFWFLFPLWHRYIHEIGHFKVLACNCLG